MVYTLVFLVGAIGFVTTLLDIFLSDGQKARLSEWSVRTWNWVDELKRKPLAQYFSSLRWQTVATIIALTPGIGWPLLYLYRYLRPFDTSNITDTTLVLLLCILACLINWRIFTDIMRYLSTVRNHFEYMTKICLVLIAILLGFFAVGPLVMALYEHNYLFAWSLSFLPYWFSLFVLALAAWIFMLLLYQFMIVGGFAAGVIILIGLAYAVLYPLELILRRIAEYPKGPILAVSALAAAIGAFGRFFLP